MSGRLLGFDQYKARDIKKIWVFCLCVCVCVCVCVRACVRACVDSLLQSRFLSPALSHLLLKFGSLYFKQNLNCHTTTAIWVSPPTPHLHQRRFRRIYLSTNPSPHDPQNLLSAQTNQPMKTPGRIFLIIPSCQSD